MTVTTKGVFLRVSVPLTADNMAKLAGMPGFTKWEGRTLLARPTGANVGYLIQGWPDLVWDAQATEHRETFERVKKQLVETADQKKIELTDDDGFVYKLKPWAHQRQAFLLNRDRENFALLMEQRTGKTKVIYDTTDYNYSPQYGKQTIDALVVVSKNGVHRNWIENELPKHLACPAAATWIQSEMSLYMKERLEKVMATKDRLRVFAFNVEGFVSEKTKYWFEKIHGEMRCLTTVDESTRIKNQSALRSKYLIKQGKRAVMRRILTGTPVTKQVEDLYSQFLFLDPMILGFDTMTTYRNHFCHYVKLDDHRIMITGYKNIDELHTILDGCSYRVLQTDCFDLPPKVYKRWPIDLTPKQMKLYKELKKEFTVEMEGQTLTAAMAMTRQMRIQQICCNWFPTDEGELLPIEESNPRVRVLVNDILEEFNGKVIIWARFKPDLDAIKRALGDKAVTYYGDGSSDNQKAANSKRFKEDPKVLYMVANAQSAAWGLDWSEAIAEVFYSNHLDLELRLQAEDRPTGKHGITVVDLEATIPEERKIIKCLQAKKNIADMITRDPKSFFLEEATEEAQLELPN